MPQGYLCRAACKALKQRCGVLKKSTLPLPALERAVLPNCPAYQQLVCFLVLMTNSPPRFPGHNIFLVSVGSCSCDTHHFAALRHLTGSFQHSCSVTGLKIGSSGIFSPLYLVCVVTLAHSPPRSAPPFPPSKPAVLKCAKYHSAKPRYNDLHSGPPACGLSKSSHLDFLSANSVKRHHILCITLLRQKRTLHANMASVTSLDKDLRKMRLDKYTPAAANEARTWVEESLGDKLSSPDLLDGLKDGVALCR